MALPADFWRDAQSLNIFRTKPCQRLLKFPQGCEWRSQCQYSHNLEWPRRPPQKHSYRPEVCTHLRRTQAANGEVQIENLCSLDKSCRNAHSKEEVLWHPDIFKTVLCEEYQVSSRSGHKNAQKKKCQRYYCPFAHGAQELRPSRFSKQEREHLIEQAELFFPIERCQPCSPQVSGTQNNAKGFGMVFLTSNGHSTQQEVSSPPHSTPAYYMSMALPDGQSDGKNHYPPSPYQQQQQFSPNGHWIQVRQPLVSPDHSQFAMAQGGLGNEGCGVPSQQMQQEVVQTTNGVPQGSGGVQQPQMMIMQPPMGCMGTPVPHSPAAFPVQQWTPPMGQTGGIGLMPVQVAAINNNAGHDNGVCNSSEVVANLLRSAGLAHHTESFEHNGFLDIEPEALVGMSASRLGISEVEHESLKNVFVEMQKGSGGRNNMAMMPSSAPRTPSVPQHCIALVDQYGNWIPANSPGPLNSESYAYGSPGPFSAPWVNSNGTPHQQQTAMMSNCFIQSVHGDQRQQAVPQQDGIMIFGQIPPFPQFDSNPQQQQHQAMAHLQQSGGQNGVHCAPMPQQRNNQPSSHVQQPFYPQLGQQPQALQQNQPQPHMQPPPQIAQQGALCNGTQGSMQSLPTSDDSPASQQIAETESNGHASAKLKKRNLKIGNRPMRDVNEDRGMSFRESRSAPALQDRAEKEVPDRWHQLR